MKKHLALTIPATSGTITGTYGTIPETLRHPVEAEEDYLSVLAGEPGYEPPPKGNVSLTDLREQMRRLGPYWEELARDDELRSRKVSHPHGVSPPGAVVMAQVLHHSTDHHPHILRAHGLDASRLDVWVHVRWAGQEL